MKKSLWLALLMLMFCAFALSACGDGNQQQGPNGATDSVPSNEPKQSGKDTHIHAFEEWMTTKKASCTEDGTAVRYCSCGEMQTQNIAAYGHTEVIDAAIAATCTEEGKTEGKHCSICNVALIEQIAVQPLGHQYNNGEITKKATCIQNGVKKFTCTVTTCGHSYTEAYSLSQYTATQIYNQSVEYVGEIITYDKKGVAAALGTGFVISSDGKIVTNYHVIDEAYSADITINGSKYERSSVLAYDVDIDLAILKVNAKGLKAATICKQPVSVGTTVYAIGSSRGMTNTYSQGIITYANRIVDGVSHVQHDASITNGNSGGPLINVYGEVIGINTWMMTDSQNLNFAVSTSELDNLVYGTPMTLQELIEKNTPVISPQEAAFYFMRDFVLARYNKELEHNNIKDKAYREVVSGSGYRDIFQVIYCEDKGLLSLNCETVYAEGDSFVLYIGFFPDEPYIFMSISYYLTAHATSPVAKGTATIYTPSFNKNSLLVFDSFEGQNKADFQALAHSMSIEALNFMEKIYLNYAKPNGFDCSIADFGFNL